MTTVPDGPASTQTTSERHAADTEVAKALLPGVASTGLPGCTGRLTEAPLANEPWAILRARCRAQRLQGLLQHAIDTGRLPVTDDQRDAANEDHLAACTSVLRLEHRLLEIADVLERVGIEPVALKGSALAHLAYPDPSQRVFGDVDVLVTSDDHGPAIAALERDLGAVRSVPELRPDYDRRFAKSATLRCPDGLEIDLHRHLLFGTFAFAVDLAELFASAVPFRIGDRRLRALGPETRLLHACYHAGLGDPMPRCSSVRDVAQLLLTGQHDPDRVLHLAEQWRSLAVLQRAIRLSRDLLGVQVDGPLASELATYRPSPPEIRAIGSYVGTDRSHSAKVLASVPFIDGAGAKVRFVAANALPSRGFTEGGRQGPTVWLRKAWRSLRRRLR